MSHRSQVRSQVTGHRSQVTGNISQVTKIPVIFEFLNLQYMYVLIIWGGGGGGGGGLAYFSNHVIYIT